MLHGAVKTTARKKIIEETKIKKSINNGGFDGFFAPIKPRLTAADLAFANMESPIAPKSHIEVKSMVFNGPPAVLYAMKDAGIDILSFANNHVYDQGQKGFFETRRRMKKAGFDVIGVGDTCKEAEEPQIVAINGLKIAWIGATELHI